MKGKFKTPDGKEVSVIEYDEPNNILFAKFPNGNRIWVGKKEYSLWQSLGGAEVPKTEHIYVPDVPAQIIEENPVQEPVTLEEVVTDYLNNPEVESLPQEPAVDNVIAEKPKRKYTPKTK